MCTLKCFVFSIIAASFVLGMVFRSTIATQLAHAYTYSVLPSLDYNLTPTVVHNTTSTTTSFSMT